MRVELAERMHTDAVDNARTLEGGKVSKVQGLPRASQGKRTWWP